MSWHVQYRFKLKQNLDANGYQRLQKHNEKWSDEVSEFSGGYGLHGNVGDSELRGSSQPSGDFHWASDALTIVRALVDLETKLDGKAYVQDPTGNSAKWLSVRKIDQPKLSKRLLETLSHVDIGDDEEVMRTLNSSSTANQTRQ